MNWMIGLLRGHETHRPSITPAQGIAGVPVIANLLAAWGIFTPTAAQQSSLSDLLNWAFVMIGADAIVRVGRNIGDGMKAKATAPPTVAS
jgi:hypothetical protein